MLWEHEELATSNWSVDNGPKWTCSPRTVRKALVVLTGMVKSEQVYWPSSDRLTSLIVMVSSCHDARTSSILWSLRAALGKTTRRITRVRKKIIMLNSVMAINCRRFVIQMTLSRRRVNAPCLQLFQMLVKCCECMLWPVVLNIFFTFAFEADTLIHSQWEYRRHCRMHWGVAAELP